MGTDAVDPTTYFEEGMILMRVASGTTFMWRRSNGTRPSGIAKCVKTLTKYKPVIYERVVLTGVALSTLNHGNVRYVRVESGTAGNAILYSPATDYTIGNANGTINRQVGSVIPAGGTVFVSYQYMMTQAEMIDEGLNWENTLDDTASTGQATVISGNCRICSDQYDTNADYRVDDPLYDWNGLPSTARGTIHIGSVLVPPTAADPWLQWETDMKLAPYGP